MKPKEQLIKLYDEMLKEALTHRYTVHCTDSQKVVDAANKALTEEYEEHTERFRHIIQEVGTDELTELRDIGEEFIKRVEMGEVRSKYTYARFIKALR